VLKNIVTASAYIMYIEHEYLDKYQKLQTIHGKGSSIGTLSVLYILDSKPIGFVSFLVGLNTVRKLSMHLISPIHSCSSWFS
jgi:hypothetical protein